jgi:putative tricarboxylic transport membrane protein
MLEGYIQGFANAFTIQCMFAIFMGVGMGIIFGAMPGISTSMGIALVLPVTYNMSIMPSMALLIGLYIGGVSGGLITAILLNIPGTPGSIATTFDGHPMARRGEAGKALGIGILYSFLGGILSLVVLFTAAPVLANVALKFSAVEYFAIIFLSFALIASLSGKSLTKGLISAIFGVILTTIGMSPIDGAFRYTFGFHGLDAGLNLLPVLVGVYAVTEVLGIAEYDTPMVKPRDYKMKGFGVNPREFKSQLFNLIRSSLIGIGIGILPGIGQNVANILAYTAAKNQSKYPEKFGTGIIDGIVASETSNNAVTGGAMIPLLTMGIPGDAGTAMLLAALTVQGIQPGPLLFTKEADLIYTIFTFLILANIVMIVTEYFGMRAFLRMLRVPKHILIPVIIVICCVGAFSVNHRVFDVFSIIVIGLLAYGMQKFKYPLAPLVLGFVLGNMFETNLRRALMFTQGSYLRFFTYPIAAVALIIFFLVIIFTAKNQIALYRKGKSE